MIEFSLGKLVLLALIALIVLGPEKLPGAARTAGAILRRVRGGWDNVRAEVERELEIEEIKKAAREAAAQAESAQNVMKGTAKAVHEPFNEALMMARNSVTEIDGPKPAAVAAESEPEPEAAQAELPLDGAATQASVDHRERAHGDD